MEKKAVKEKMQISKTGICNNKTGYTLLELVLVIFILSIAAAVVLPSIAVFQTNKINSDAKRVASILRFLNDTAITTKETSLLKIDLKKRLLIYSTAEGKKEETFDTVRSVQLQSKGMLSDGEITLFFHPTGAAESMNLYLSDGKSNLMVSFNNLSGRVKIIPQ